MSDIKYHLQRARAERDHAYQSGQTCVSDAHMRLSALHLRRALVLQELGRAPAGDVTSVWPAPDVATAGAPVRVIQLPSRG